jgi:hypothetical protein
MNINLFRIRSSSCFICLSDTGIRVNIKWNQKIIFVFSRLQFENNGQMQPTLWRHRRLQSEIRALRVCIQLQDYDFTFSTCIIKI